jgi:beta-glucanase (GH16 family)
VTIDHKHGVLTAKVTMPWAPEGCNEKDFSQRFGFFEIRCKIPDSPAMWPAFWLSGAMDWPPEIDIFEIYTTKAVDAFESNYHWGANDQCFGHDSDVAGHKVNDTTASMHIYACEWDSCFIKWYYDNLLVRVAYKHVTNVFEPMRVIVSAGIDDMNDKSYASHLKLPASFDVDYVRVYAR